jgi:hypothetical protein
MRPEGDPNAGQEQQAYSPWTIVNVVFEHLVDQGLRPTMGSAGDPGGPAAALLRALGVAASAEGDPRLAQRTRDDLARMRAQMDLAENGD